MLPQKRDSTEEERVHFSHPRSGKGSTSAVERIFAHIPGILKILSVHLAGSYRSVPDLTDKLRSTVRKMAPLTDNLHLFPVQTILVLC